MAHILLDIDCVVADFTGAVCKQLTLDGFPGYDKYSFTNYNMRSCLKEPAAQLAFDRMPYRPGFCAAIERLPGAQDFYKALKAQGHHVEALTAKWGDSPFWEQERYEWLVSFGFNDRDIHIVPNSDAKKLFAADCIIEDRLQTLVDWPHKGLKILLHYPWNHGHTPDGIIRVGALAGALIHTSMLPRS